MFRIDRIDPGNVAETLDAKGICVIDDFCSPAVLGKMQSFIHSLTKSLGNEYYSYAGIENMPDSPIVELARSGEFREKLLAACNVGMGHDYATQKEIYHVLRVMIGETGVERAHQYHFDAFSITALLPIITPTVPDLDNGHLLIYPNFRREYTGVFTNLLSKIRWQGKSARQKVQTEDFIEKRGRLKMVMKPGNLYLFWGTRCLHANERCDPASLRATALYHFGNPHFDSRILNGIRDFRNRNEAEQREVVEDG
jgi:hypothetical protein